MARGFQPGLHDPYWYEATVGLRYVVDLLDSESGIIGVTFQQPAVEGLDDVVVTHADGRRTGVQVKHTRTDAPLTFNDLVAGREDRPSLLRKLTRGWKALSAGGVRCTTRLFSNRQLPEESPRRNAQPALGAFWRVLNAAIAEASALTDIQISPEYDSAWKSWLAELDELEDNESKFEFLRTLRIDGGQLDIEGLETEVIARLTAIFGNVPPSVAEQIYALLVRRLSTWTTSRRETATEVHAEDVYAAIRIPHEETVGDHDFPPPAPFFPSRVEFAEALARDLRASPEPVTFLTGPAGCGKTSIVSSLANRAHPAVDLRFYAFRPIGPGSATLPQDYSQTATAAALWGDLLTQLRTRHFVGRLNEAGVPARNDLFMDNPARLREHVLQLAGKLADERGRPTVIAIDGLDHAARARTLSPEQLVGRPSLLDWLVPPSEVPAGVRFLIAGQPQYDRYPSWLRNRTSVRTIEVPPIAQEDIEALLQRNHGTFPEDQIQRAAAIISELSRGNTLAAVYAVVEAQTQTDALALRTQLEERQLQEGLDAYYSRIWQAALHGSVPATDASLAAALTLSSARLTGERVCGFYPDIAFGVADWEEALRKLAPIVEEQDGTFAVRHNDVRVFLAGRLQAIPGAHARAASSIANYYLSAEPTPAKYADLVRALALANRHAELPTIFTPAYVVEAWTVERPVTELLDQARHAMSAVQPQIGWAKLHDFALGLRTLQQLRVALSWLEDSGPPPPLPSCLPSEARPTPRALWSVASVQAVLRDTARLAVAGDIARARDLLRRWFQDLSPVDVVEELRQHPGDLEPMAERDLPETLYGLARAWGALAQQIGVPRSTLRASLEDEAGTTMAHFYGGWLTAGVGAQRPWVRTLRVPRIWFYRDVETAVRELARAERWTDVAVTLGRSIETRAKFSPRFQIAAAPWALRTGNAAIIAAWAQPVADGGFLAANDIEYSLQEEDIQLYDAIAYTLGWLEPTRPGSAISEEGADAYFARRTYESGQANLRRHLYATAIVARLDRAAAATPTDLEAVVRADELAAIVRAFFVQDTDRGHEVIPFAHRTGPLLLARILAVTEGQQNGAYSDAVMPVILARAGELLYDTYLEVLWRAAAKRGLNDLLERWATRWIGSTGEVWRMDLGDRAEAVRRFAALARQSGLGNVAATAERRLRRSQVGYVGRKEYALALPLEWFDMVARDTTTVWETEGARLLSISCVASEGGDNRMAISVEAAVTVAAARSGPQSLWRCLTGLAARYEPGIALARTSAIDGIIGALEHSAATEHELRSLWCIGVGSLVWEYERHRLMLEHLRKGLLAVGTARGHVGLPAALAAIAPRAFEVRGNEGVFRYPPRWFSTRETNEPPPYRRGAEALVADLSALSLDDALARLETVATGVLNDGGGGSSSDLWRGVADTATRLGDTRPANFHNLLERLVAITRQRTAPYPWFYDSLEEAFTALIPLMTDTERWDLCAWIIETLDDDEAREFWVETAAKNLASLCGIRAMAGTTEDRRSGLARELAAQETWILGPDQQGRPRWPLVAWPEADAADPQSWASFGIRGLTQIVGHASGTHRVQAAMRGLYALISLDPSLASSLVSEWKFLPEDRRELLLLLVERLIVDLPETANVLRPLLEAAAITGAGRQKLQAMVALDASARSAEPVDVQFPETTGHAHPLLPATAGLLQVGQEMCGAIPLTRGTSAVRSAVQQLAAALDLDEDSLERAAVAALGHSVTSMHSQRRPTDALDGEMLLRPSNELDRLSDWAFDEAAAGCFGTVDPLLLAQAMLNMDDPWVLTRPTAGLIGSATWRVDKELEALLTVGGAAAIDELTSQTNTGIGDGERVLAAVLHTFTRETDVVFHLETRWVRDVTSLRNLRGASTFNGRTFTYYQHESFEPDQRQSAGWLTFRTGGQGVFFHSSVPLTPATKVWRFFGWEPRATDPFTWQTADGLAVARFEIWNGPVRDATQDRLYRQPFICRWIVTEGAWQRMEQALAATLRTMSDLTTHPAK